MFDLTQCYSTLALHRQVMFSCGVRPGGASETHFATVPSPITECAAVAFTVSSCLGVLPGALLGLQVLASGASAENTAHMQSILQQCDALCATALGFGMATRRAPRRLSASGRLEIILEHCQVASPRVCFRCCSMSPSDASHSPAFRSICPFSTGSAGGSQRRVCRASGHGVERTYVSGARSHRRPGTAL